MGLMQKLLLSCKKAAALIDRRSVAPLALTERAQLWMHVNICHGCKAFKHQSDTIDHLLERERAVDVSDRAAVVEKRVIDALK